MIKRYHLIKITILLIPVIFLTACTSLSKDECHRGDWENIGRKDAVNGLLSNAQLSNHRSACSRYRIIPNNRTYYLGYKQGLKQFCRREVGYQHGSNGMEYLANCPSSLEGDFLAGYIPGLELAIDNIQNDIDDLKRRRNKVNRKLDDLHHSGESKKKDKKRIKKMEEKLESMQSDISSKRDERNKLRSWYSIW